MKALRLLPLLLSLAVPGRAKTSDQAPQDEQGLSGLFDGARPFASRSGPVPSGDLNPAHAVFFSLVPESARLLDEGALGFELKLSQTNSMEGTAIADGGQGLLHAETLRTTLSARYGLAPGLEAGLIVPLVFRTRAGMDGFIAKVEEGWMGHTMPARARYQGSPTLYQYESPGGRVSSPEGSWGLGDAALTIKAKLLPEGRLAPGLSLRLGLKAPTGDRALGFGSGTFDAALGLALEKALTSWLVAYGCVAGTAPLEFSGSVVPFVSGSLGLEALMGDHVSFVVQFDSYSSPFSGTGQAILDGRDDLWLAGLNVTGDVAGQKMRAGIFATENVFLVPGGRWAGSANDFTLGLVLGVEPQLQPRAK